MFSAIVTGGLLFLNGSLVLAIVAVLRESEVPYMTDPGVTQVILFLLPLILVVLQWMMIDYVRRHVLTGRTTVSPEEN